jgi:hypothetical protein
VLFAHVAGFPVEETVLAFLPAWAVFGGALAARARRAGARRRTKRT